MVPTGEPGAGAGADTIGAVGGSAEQPAYLHQAVERLAEALGARLVGVVLYGSRGRSEAREASDVDLLVIAHDLPARWYARAAHLHGILRSMSGAPPFSVLGRTPEEFERHFPSLYLDIGLDGRILYDRDGYTSGRLQRIRDIIARAGLIRQRAGPEMGWVWRNPPTRPWEITWAGFRELAG